MRYEKRLIILSGYGKGVVMAERSGLGVKFALRTFGLPRRTDYKAGIVTPTFVAVRDLPSSADPAAVFFLDDTPLDKLHFAVFDDELCLYGATCPKMWESNLMDLLKKDAAPFSPPGRVVPAPTLPPIASPPKTLPLPDGTGIPQSRLELYGDEAIANDNFYSTIDLESAMPRVDSFLDGPRILSRDVAPQITPRSMGVSPSEITLETTATADGQDLRQSAENEGENAVNDEINEYEDDGIIRAVDDDAIGDGATEAASVGALYADVPSGGNIGRTEIAEKLATEKIEKIAPVSESPSELEAKWLLGRSQGATITPKAVKVKKARTVERVRPIRETAFIERNSDDVDKLFSLAPKDEELTKLLPDIEWVKVAVDGQSVSVGRSGNSFLCYAVAGVYEKCAPIDDAQWLPLVRTAPTGKGYWLVFQDLVGGGIIKNQ